MNDILPHPEGFDHNRPLNDLTLTRRTPVTAIG